MHKPMEHKEIKAIGCRYVMTYHLSSPCVPCICLLLFGHQFHLVTINLSGKTIIGNIRTGESDLKNTMEYKGYIGSVEFSEADGVFFGKVMGIKALISYEGTNAKELVDDFHGAVDDYLALCTDQGTEPEKAYKGSFK